MSTTVVLLLLTALQAAAQQPSAPPKTEQEAFILEYTSVRHRFEDDGTGRRESQARIKVQSEAGVQMLGQLVFGYNAGTEKLDILYVRVRKADGSVVTAPPDSVQDLTSPVQQVAPVYTDFRQKHVTVPGLRPGETLEYAIVNTVHTALASGHFWTEHEFETDAIVLDERLEIDVPASRSVLLKTRPGFDPKVADADGRRVYRWSTSHPEREKEKDEETQQAEAEAASENPKRSAVRLTTFKSWDEVAQWYTGVEKGSRTVTPEIRRKAEELTAGKSRPLDKVEALYNFVAPGFRYVSISLGMGRYQPRRAADVLRDQYGDCKDKHTLLAALMEAVGIQASTVLINSQSRIDPEFPSPSQFDHAITRASVDGQDLWMDVTTEVAPFRMLSSNLRKKQALVISAAAQPRLMESPADLPFANQIVHDIAATLGELGTFAGTVTLSARGDAELWLRTVFRRTPEAKWKEVIEGINDNAGPGGEVSDWKVSDPATTRDPFVLQWKVSKTGLVDWTKKSTAIKLPYSEASLPQPRENRTIPLEFGGIMTIDYRLDLTLGPGYTARAPIPVALTRDYGTYAATYSVEGQRFKAQRLLQVKVGSIAVDRFGDYNAFRRAIVSDHAQTLSLDVAATTASSAPADLKPADLVRTGRDAINAGNYQQAITLLKRAVELDAKNARGWSALGDAHAAERAYDDALAAYRKLLEVSPYDENVHNKIAWIHRLQRRYTEAETSFRKQLEQNPLDKYAHTNLAGLLLDMKRFADAVPLLEKAITIDPDNAAGLQVELGTAFLNTDQSDKALVAFAKAVELSGEPLTWNNIAYQLALKGAHLDRAMQYAESAVSSAAAASRQLTVDRVTARELAVVRALASYWDTMGWVYFAKGDLARAETFVKAAWTIAENGEIGDHLGQIYEKQGRRDEAIRSYVAALNTDDPLEETKTRLNAVLGEGKDHGVSRADVLKMRSYALQPAAKDLGQADFVVLIGQDGKVESVKFVSGADKLQPLAEAIRKVDFGALPTPAKVLRRGTVSCEKTGCSFVLFPAGHAQPVQQ